MRWVIILQTTQKGHIRGETSNPTSRRGEARKYEVLSWHWVKRGEFLFPANVNHSPELPEMGCVSLHNQCGPEENRTEHHLQAKIFHLEESQVESTLGGGGKQAQILAERSR